MDKIMIEDDDWQYIERNKMNGKSHGFESRRKDKELKM